MRSIFLSEFAPLFIVFYRQDQCPNQKGFSPPNSQYLIPETQAVCSTWTELFNPRRSNQPTVIFRFLLEHGCCKTMKMESSIFIYLLQDLLKDVWLSSDKIFVGTVAAQASKSKIVKMDLCWSRSMRNFLMLLIHKGSFTHIVYYLE